MQRPLPVPAVLHGIVSAAHEAAMKHASRRGAFPCGGVHGPPGTSAPPCRAPSLAGAALLPPAHTPMREGAAAVGAQALRVRKRNNSVSKLRLDMIAAEPQKLSGQKPQKLGMLLSRAH